MKVIIVMTKEELAMYDGSTDLVKEIICDDYDEYILPAEIVVADDH